MHYAITREVSSGFNECEITHIDRKPIDLKIAQRQHKEYVKALSELGCQLIELPEEPNLPDSVFVEDTALILPEVAVITRPRTASRKPGTQNVAKGIAHYRPLDQGPEPGFKHSCGVCL